MNFSRRSFLGGSAALFGSVATVGTAAAYARRTDRPRLKMGVISDTHIGSVYSPDEWHDIVADYANENGVEAVLHCGDLTDGVKISRAGTQIYELSEVGFEAQKAKAVELLGKYEVPVYIISGNHDAYYKEFAGANVVASVAQELPNVTHIGDDEADIEIDGVTIRLFHGGDGSSYALSYRLQTTSSATSSSATSTRSPCRACRCRRPICVARSWPHIRAS